MPIIINNIGKSDLEGYNLVISFNCLPETKKNIELVDVKTESAKIDSIYCNEKYFGSQGKEAIPSKEIKKYYKRLNMNNHMVVIKGSLESFVYELLYFKIHVPAEILEFYITYKVYPINRWTKSFRYAQLIRIKNR